MPENILWTSKNAEKSLLPAANGADTAENEPRRGVHKKRRRLKSERKPPTTVTIEDGVDAPWGEKEKNIQKIARSQYFLQICEEE